MGGARPHRPVRTLPIANKQSYGQTFYCQIAMTWSRPGQRLTLYALRIVCLEPGIDSYSNYIYTRI